LSNWNRERRQRLRDFECRVRFWLQEQAPEYVLEHRSRNWRYVPVNPMTDEPVRADLATAEDRDAYWGNDAYWAVNHDVLFLEIQPMKPRRDEPNSIYVRVASCRGALRAVLHIALVTDNDVLTRQRFEDLMAEVSVVLPSRKRLRSLRRDGRWVRLV